MSDNILKIEGLSKSFGKNKVLDNINLTIKHGEIFGVVGKNGVGKTTIMKCVLGLISSYEGKISLMDEKSLVQGRARTGSMIDDPGFFKYMSGIDNLKYFARVYNCYDEREIDELLKVVGLYEARKRKVGKYSLGMKQRLGLATALLGKPEFLILDEPINGIDPEGIVEIRNMLKEYVEKNNASIFISSHILSELEQLCDKYVIMDAGKIVKQFEQKNMPKAKKTIVFSTDDDEKVMEALKLRGIKFTYKDEFIIDDETKVNDLLKIILESGLEITYFENKKRKLEDIYLESIGG